MKKVLVSPLNWGLGHAARCIPVINELLKQEAEVTVASDGGALNLLKHEFPGLKFFELPAYNISYSRNSNMAFKMFSNFMNLRKAITEEHIVLSNIQRENNFDVIISDNRYGMWTNHAHTVFITHHLQILAPAFLKWMEPALIKYNLSLISKFNECWIPDFEGAKNLSGILSHHCSLPSQTFYIGPLSRFSIEVGDRKPEMEKMHPDLLIILSGPEPQRTIFEEIILEQVKTFSGKTLIVQGLTNKFEEQQLPDNVRQISFLTSGELFEAISKADLIISRSGYSTIMDLISLGKKAILVPTPGQTEQEYLAGKFLNEGIFYSTKQSVFNLKESIEKSKLFSGKKTEYDGNILSEAIKKLLK